VTGELEVVTAVLDQLIGPEDHPMAAIRAFALLMTNSPDAGDPGPPLMRSDRTLSGNHRNFPRGRCQGLGASDFGTDSRSDRARATSFSASGSRPVLRSTAA
jgi:hypothetical protein